MEPTSPARQRLRLVRRIGVGTAYACFLWVALVTGGFLSLELLPGGLVSLDTAQLLGMAVGLPLLISAFGAAALGIMLALAFWRERPLLVNLACVALLVLLFRLEGSGAMSGREAFLGATLCLAVMLAVFVRWVAFSRSGPER